MAQDPKREEEELTRKFFNLGINNPDPITSEKNIDELFESAMDEYEQQREEEKLRKHAEERRILNEYLAPFVNDINENVRAILELKQNIENLKNYCFGFMTNPNPRIILEVEKLFEEKKGIFEKEINNRTREIEKSLKVISEHDIILATQINLELMKII